MQNTLIRDAGEMRVSENSESSFCLICNSFVNVADSLNIFYTSLPRNGESLANFVLEILNVRATDLVGSYVCSRCYELFKTLEQAEWTASNVKYEILKVYREKGERKYERDEKEEDCTRRLNESEEDSESMNNAETEAAINFDNDYTSDKDSSRVERREEKLEEKEMGQSENVENFDKNESSNNSAWKLNKISKCGEKALKYSCTTCDKKWRTSAELKTHVESHSNLRPYMCEKCGRAYKRKRALEIHVGMHNGVSPFKCDVCDKCFTQKGALMRHLPMHTGETPYQCELCGKRYVHHTSYNMHALSHTGKKSYQCHVCDLYLLSTSHLKRHMRVHTGEKPYSCSLCGKSFAERYNLSAHRKIHDPVEIMAKAARKQKLENRATEGDNEERNKDKFDYPKIDEKNSEQRENFSNAAKDFDSDESWRETNYEKLTNFRN